MPIKVPLFNVFKLNLCKVYILSSNYSCFCLKVCICPWFYLPKLLTITKNPKGKISKGKIALRHTWWTLECCGAVI